MQNTQEMEKRQERVKTRKIHFHFIKHLRISNWKLKCEWILKLGWNSKDDCENWKSMFITADALHDFFLFRFNISPILFILDIVRTYFYKHQWSESHRYFYKWRDLNPFWNEPSSLELYFLKECNILNNIFCNFE